jgi:hypothetical protein
MTATNAHCDFMTSTQKNTKVELAPWSSLKSKQAGQDIHRFNPLKLSGK